MKITNSRTEILPRSQFVVLAEESAYTPAELSVYQSYWDQVSREKTLMHGKYIEGLAEGEAKGIEKKM